MQATSSGGSISSGGGGGGGGGGGLARFRSAPATWLEALLEEEEEDPLKPNQNLTQLLASGGSLSEASRNPFGSEAEEAASGAGGGGGGGLLGLGGGGGGGFQRQNSSPADFLGSNSGIGGDGYFSSYGMGSNYEYLSTSMDVSPSGKRGRELELQNPSANNYPTQLKVEQTGLGPARATSLIEMEMDKLLEDSVPCRVRAKRGCATHPRSIAERVRRTKISDRIRKLQELVPNMDKQTNTADMLEEAVEYVKFLQRQIQELTEHQRKCKCIAREQ